ncbi:alpha-galactosidase AgaA [Abditibacteriota bacterium]|nr:alpha-galactosidase AgaA [Abditibacteriota bacterium]
MPISVHDRTFHLRTSTCSYIFAALPSGYLTHLYFGAPLRDAHVAHLLDDTNRAFSPYLPSGIMTDTLPQEAPSYGTGDFREPLVEIAGVDGTTASEFAFIAHRITDGKPTLDGLPSFYVEDESEAQTLEIELQDPISGAVVVLLYTAFEELGAITRSVRVENRAQTPLHLRRVLSASVDFPTADLDWIHLSGAWSRERDVVRSALRSGTQSVESRRGASSHQQNPFFALCSPQTTETAGEAWGFNLVYSGNFYAGIEVDQYGTPRAQIGINPFDFGWELQPGATFQAPEAVMLYSGAGLGALSRGFHRLIRQRLCRGAWRDRVRPVLVNSWEASYFNIDEETIVHLGEAARDAGIELLVMDDGWFGYRDNDTTSLGDWTPHAKKFPNGLSSLANRLNTLGLTFGLWLEPEMVSPDSDLYRSHPDWCLHVPGRRRTEARQQLVLDLSRSDVCDYLIETLAGVLSGANIGYIKWDMNRHMTEIGSALLPANQQRETAHRTMLGLYRVLDELTKRFPDVLFESCSGGGGRFDLGLLPFMPQAWTSDNTDAIARLRIQEGTSLAYPAISMGSHVSDSPNHQLHRTTPIGTRGAVALAGAFGYELDLNKLSDSEKEAIKRQVAFAKEVREITQFGDFYRLKSVFPTERNSSNESAWMFVSRDQREAVVTWVQVLALPNAAQSLLHLAGLNPSLDYELILIDLDEQSKAPSQITPLVLGGDVLMNAGIRVANHRGDFRAKVWHLKAK